MYGLFYLVDIKLHKAHLSTSSDHPGCPKVIAWVMCLMWLKVKIIICRKWKHYCNDSAKASQCCTKGLEVQGSFNISGHYDQQRDSCRGQELLEKAQHARRFPVMLFYSHQVENKKQRSNSQHTLNSSEFRKYEALDCIQHLFWYLKCHTRNKTECGEAFYSKCIQETAWTSVKTT